MLKKLLKKHWISLALFLFTFLLYLHNLSASVYGGDSGDFLSAIAVKGVPHPSGYPLYTLLGIMMSYLRIKETLAWKVDILSALFSSLSVVLVYKNVNELLGKKILGIITALSVAFMFPFWLFAEVSEVIALNNFLLLLLTYSGILFYKTKKYRYLYALALTTGLSFSNHEITLLLLPSLTILLIKHLRKILKPKVIVLCIVLFVIGLIPYLYIPIAASQHPLVNWDNATSVQNLLHLVFRKDYGWVATDSTQLKSTRGALGITDYYNYLIDEIPILAIIFIVAGVFYLLWKRKYIIFLSIFTAFFLFGPFYITYGAGIILNTFNHGVFEKFYTISIIFLFLLFPFGVQFCIELLQKALDHITQGFNSKVIATITILFLAFLSPFILFIRNVETTNLSSLWLGDKFGYDILKPLPNNSILITTQDNSIFNSRYMEYARGVGNHISIFIPTEAVDYIAQNKTLSKQLSKVIQKSGNQLSVNYRAIYSALNTSHPVFTTENNLLSLSLKQQNPLIPYGLVLKLASNQEKYMNEQSFLEKQNIILNGIEHDGYETPKKGSLDQYLLIEEIPKVYANAYVNTGYFLIINYRDFKTAKQFFEKALSVYDFELAYQGLGDYYHHVNDCKTATTMYTKAIDINPVDKLSYAKLYDVDKNCLKDQKATKQLEDLFQKYPHLFEGVKQ